MLVPITTRNSYLKLWWMFEIRFTKFHDNSESSITRFAVWTWVWCHNATRCCSTVEALWKGSGGFLGTVDFVGRLGCLWKISLKETCFHTRCAGNFSSACLPEEQDFHQHCSLPQFFLLPGSTALKNFALLYFDLNWYLLKKFETELHRDGGEIRK